MHEFERTAALAGAFLAVLVVACAPLSQDPTPVRSDVARTSAAQTPRPSLASEVATGSPVPPLDAADHEVFIFASGPACYSFRVVTGELLNLTFPPDWTVEERGSPGCGGPRDGSSIAEVRSPDGSVFRAGEVVRVTGSATTDPDGWEPAMIVSSMAPLDIAASTALAAAFRAEGAGIPPAVLARTALPPCGIVVGVMFAREPDVPPGETNDAVLACVREAHAAGEGAEWLSIRDSIDAGYSTALRRLLPDGRLEIWTLGRNFQSEPLTWSLVLCDGLEVAPSQPATLEMIGCVLQERA